MPNNRNDRVGNQNDRVVDDKHWMMVGYAGQLAYAQPVIPHDEPAIQNNSQHLFPSMVKIVKTAIPLAVAGLTGYLLGNNNDNTSIQNQKELDRLSQENYNLKQTLKLHNITTDQCPANWSSALTNHEGGNVNTNQTNKTIETPYTSMRPTSKRFQKMLEYSMGENISQEIIDSIREDRLLDKNPQSKEDLCAGMKVVEKLKKNGVHHSVIIEDQQLFSNKIPNDKVFKCLHSLTQSENDNVCTVFDYGLDYARSSSYYGNNRHITSLLHAQHIQNSDDIIAKRDKIQLKCDGKIIDYLGR